MSVNRKVTVPVGSSLNAHIIAGARPRANPASAARRDIPRQPADARPPRVHSGGTYQEGVVRTPHLPIGRGRRSNGSREDQAASAHLRSRHTFATFALRAGISTFDLSRYMGTSLAMIDRHYGHFARNGREHTIRLLD